MNGFKVFWRFVVIVTVTLSAILVGLSFTPMMRASNCGGNSSALHRVHSLKNFAAMAIAERHDGIFSFTELSDAELDQLVDLVDSSWHREAKF